MGPTRLDGGDSRAVRQGRSFLRALGRFRSWSSELSHPLKLPPVQPLPDAFAQVDIALRIAGDVVDPIEVP